MAPTKIVTCTCSNSFTSSMLSTVPVLKCVIFKSNSRGGGGMSKVRWNYDSVRACCCWQRRSSLGNGWFFEILKSSYPASPLQNRLFILISIYFGVFWKLKCIRIHPKQTLNFISVLETVRKPLKSSSQSAKMSKCGTKSRFSNRLYPALGESCVSIRNTLYRGFER